MNPMGHFYEVDIIIRNGERIMAESMCNDVIKSVY